MHVGALQIWDDTDGFISSPKLIAMLIKSKISRSKNNKITKSIIKWYYNAMFMLVVVSIINYVHY